MTKESTGLNVPSKTPIPVLKLEIANSLIHGMGVLFGIVAVPLLLVLAGRVQGLFLLVAVAVYGFSFLMVFTFSTLYHGFQQPLVKKVMKVLDHISIYFMIAGSYTPFIYCYYFNSQGVLMLKMLWSLAIVGSLLKTFLVNRFQLLSVAVYFLMGWTLLWTGTAFFSAMPPLVVTLILTGNFLYTSGLVFYLWQRWAYHHAYWHTLVLAAAICHYAGVFVAVSSVA
jgi:hemolysin III